MRIFLSWAESLSHDVALQLHEWLPCVLQSCNPYVSSEDLRKGNRWGIEIARQLEQSDQGIICLTRNNLESPWIHFEAGALSKSLDEASVWTLLLDDLTPGDVVGPLAQFQHTSVTQEDIWRLLISINEKLGEDGLDEGTLRRVFENFWPELEESVQAELAKPREQSQQDVRSTESMVEEVLELTRQLAKSVNRGDVEYDINKQPVYNYKSILKIAPTTDESQIKKFQTLALQDDRVRKGHFRVRGPTTMKEAPGSGGDSRTPPGSALVG